MRSRAIIFAAANVVEVGEVEIPAPGEGQYLIETQYSAISPGTELRNLSGKQHGVPFPCVPGYSNVGRIIARGKNTTLAEGTMVFSRGTTEASIGRMWGGHVEYAVQSEVRPLPAGLEPLDAVLLKLSAISYHGVRCAPPAPQARAAVVGLGPIGQLSARHYDISGAKVLGVDLAPWRVDVARRAGIEAKTPDAGLAETIQRHFPDGPDILVDCTGSAAVVPQLVKAAREFPWGHEEVRPTTYVVQGSFPGDMSISYGDLFLKELRIVVPRDSSPLDYAMSLERMVACKLRCRDLVTEVRKPEDAPRTFAELQDKGNALMTVAFEWKKP